MPKLNITIDISDDQLNKACKFLCSDDITAAAVRKDFFDNPIFIDFEKIEDQDRRTYQANGIVAALVMLIEST